MRRWFAGRTAPEWSLAASMLLWAVVFGIHGWNRHEQFQSFGYDMGIYDQGLWLIARGEQFVTIRGLEFFGHHANLAMLLLVPFSWLGAGPHFLNLLQTASLAAGALPIFLLARHRFGHGWAAPALATAYLLHPTTQFLGWELFHPDTMAIAPLLFAYLAAVKQRWVWYGAALGLAIAWKEDVALAAVVLGLALVVAGRPQVGTITVAAGFAWFLLDTRLIIPAASGMPPFYADFLGDIGNSPLSVLATAFREPSLILSRLTDESARTYAWRMLAPYAFLPIAAPAVVALGLPQTAINLLSIHTFTEDVRFHYAALPLAALSLAAVEGIAVVSNRPAVRRSLAGAVAVAALATTVAWGISPLGRQYREGYWALAPDSRLEAKQAALSLVPPRAAVAATYQFTPHLSHRLSIYEWPNPWISSYWGIKGERPHDPELVSWLALDTQLVGPDTAQLYDRLIGSEFEVRFEQDGIVVAERVG